MYMEPGQRHREDHQTRVGNRGNGPYRGNSHNTSRADELHLQRRQTNNSQIHNQQFDDHFVDNRKVGIKVLYFNTHTTQFLDSFLQWTRR